MLYGTRNTKLHNGELPLKLFMEGVGNFKVIWRASIKIHYFHHCTVQAWVQEMFPTNPLLTLCITLTIFAFQTSNFLRGVCPRAQTAIVVLVLPSLAIACL